MIGNHGEIKVPYWRHKSGGQCDPWWENETRWHRSWKDMFPLAWQEVVHHAADGERHIADVKTPVGLVLEFQYSYIKPAEVRSREAFYKELIWVVNGWRRSGDQFSLPSTWQNAAMISENSPVRRVHSKSTPLLRDWGGSHARVFFDFHDKNERDTADDDRTMWWLSSIGDNEWSYVAPYPRSVFVENYRIPDTKPDRQVDSLIEKFDGDIATFQAEAKRAQAEAKRAATESWSLTARRLQSLERAVRATERWRREMAKRRVEQDYDDIPVAPEWMSPARSEESNTRGEPDRGPMRSRDARNGRPERG